MAADMLIRGLPDATIRFFLKAFQPLRESTCSATELALYCGCAAQTASDHLNLLTAEDYTEREHYRGWRLNRQILKDLKEFTDGRSTH